MSVLNPSYATTTIKDSQSESLKLEVAIIFCRVTHQKRKDLEQAISLFFTHLTPSFWQTMTQTVQTPDFPSGSRSSPLLMSPLFLH